MNIFRTLKQKFDLVRRHAQLRSDHVDLQEQKANLIVSLDTARRDLKEQRIKYDRLFENFAQTRRESIRAEQLITAIKTITQDYEYPLTRNAVMRLMAQR
jgi:hypothetical protein